MLACPASLHACRRAYVPACMLVCVHAWPHARLQTYRSCPRTCVLACLQAGINGLRGSLGVPAKRASPARPAFMACLCDANTPCLRACVRACLSRMPCLTGFLLAFPHACMRERPSCLLAWRPGSLPETWLGCLAAWLLCCIEEVTWAVGCRLAWVSG